MELQGTHQFKAPLPAVWDALLDPVVLAKALPGGDKLERVGENDYKAAMNVKVGPVQGRFEGQVTISDVETHKGYRMKVSGTGAPGFLNGEGSLTLTENAAGTLLNYSGDVQIGGRIAAVGQRLVDSTAKSIIRQGLKTLDEQLVGGAAPALAENARPATASSASNAAATASSPATPAADAPAPSTSQPSASQANNAVPPPAMSRIALDITKDIVQDLTSNYVPRDKQPQLFAFIMGALAMLFFVIVVRAVQRDS